MKLGLQAVGLVLVVGVVLLVSHYTILVQGNCAEPEQHRISKFRGQVVGKSLGVLQYRWLRRRFAAIGTELHLSRILPDTHYDPSVIKKTSAIGDIKIDGTGTFDFGELPAGDYSLTVVLPGEDAVDFGFTIDPLAPPAEVLIDASPGHYCWCCGWNFETH